MWDVVLEAQVNVVALGEDDLGVHDVLYVNVLVKVVVVMADDYYDCENNNDYVAVVVLLVAVHDVEYAKM